MLAKHMMKLNKYELGGIALSIAALSLALFLMRLDGTLDRGFSAKQTSGTNQEASVVNAVQLEDLSNALSNSMVGDRVTDMVVTDLTLGTGTEVRKGDTVVVNYIGTLQNGQEFDSSYKKGEVFTFKVGGGKVIAGFDEGIVGMKEGGQRVLIIPARLAYGSKGYGPIPSNATVVYAIELIEIK